MLRIDILTVFPEMVESALEHSIVKRARETGKVAIQAVNLRDFTADRHKTTDDTPYGGGGGMVMKIEPIALALQALTGMTLDELAANAQKSKANAPGVPSNGQDAVTVCDPPRPRIAITDPRGAVLTQATARQWATESHLILLCGHYEGVDERVRQYLATDEVSIGDYILTGGELPALVIADALTRLQPGALGDEDAPENDSFADNLLEYPHYTRPAEYQGWRVPEVLANGHHALITLWRRWHQLHATRQRRPDLLSQGELSPLDTHLLQAEEPTTLADLNAALRATRASRRKAKSEVRMTEEDEEKHGSR